MASVRIHKSERSTAISTNAATEQEFIAAFVELGETPTVTLMAQFVDVCCKLRGYKANVVEHKIIVAGEWMPDDVVEVFARERVRELVRA